MARKANTDTPPGFERHPTDSTKFRCIACREADPLKVGNWIKKLSIKRHNDSAPHLTVLARTEELVNRKAAEAQRLQNIYSMGTTEANTSSTDPTVRSRERMFSGGAGDTPMQQSTSTGNINEMPHPMSLDSFFGNTEDVSAGLQPMPTHDPAKERERLRQQVELLLQQAEHDDEFGSNEEDITVTNISSQFAAIDLENDTQEDDEDWTGPDIDPDYSPYPNKLTMLLDIVDNLPRLRLSTNQLKLILWLLKESGVSDVPSYGGFRKTQKTLQHLTGSTPTKHVSSLGNVHYKNSIRETTMRDLANPEVAKHFHPYVEETKGPVSESYQADRLKEFDPSKLTPMFSEGHRQFFIEELTQLQDGSFVIPRNLIVRDGELTSDCNTVTHTPNGWKIEAGTRIVHTKQFQWNYIDICARIGDSNIPWSADCARTVPIMPNSLRELAGDDDLYVAMVPLWCDDVSGNKSKQYNKHINIYMVNANLPGRLLQQEYFVRFVSTSPHATSPEQFSAVKDEINETHTNPIRCYNSHTKKNCRVILRVPDLPADNPQQSDESSHMGGGANCKCRKCKVGGSYRDTETNEGYHAHYMVGIKRTAEDTRNCLIKQIDLAMYGVAKPIKDMQTATGTKDKVAQYWIDILLVKAKLMKKEDPRRSGDEIASELRTWFKEQPGDKINPLLSIAGLDPTQDTPVEILHTVLLGIVKYAWHNLHTSWSEADQDLFTIRLQSTDIDGLSVPPIRAAYMMQYRNGLIGKHFKTLMQSLPFHVHGMTTPEQFALVKAIGELGSLLWVPEIEDMDQYLTDLEVLVGNVLDAFGDVDPSKILVKMKLQILPHLIEDIRRFGPAIRYSTEIFECFNAVFRLCSILSNHLAPSRDIATKFASMDRLKHILSGGYWKQAGSDEWVQAAPNVRQVLHTDPTIQRHLGWVPPRKVTAGSVRLEGLKKSPAFNWEDSKAAKYCRIPSTLGFSETVHWRIGKNLTAKSGDICSVGSWVFVRNNTDQLVIGRVAEIIGPDIRGAAQTGVATIEVFRLGREQHPVFKLPILRRPEDSIHASHISIHAKHIAFAFSVQHDCRTAGCEATALRAQLQEREATTRMDKLIAHSDDDHFLVNTYALHNAVLLRKAIPRELYAPIALYSDRKEHHFEQASKLRILQAGKRENASKKRKETAAAKAAKAAAAAAADRPDLESEDSDDESDEEEEEPLDSEGSDSDEEEQIRPRKRKRKTQRV